MSSLPGVAGDPPPPPATAPSCSSAQLDKLIEAADRTKLRAYADYSKFRVGAALLAADGSIFSGCNVENSSYGLTMCAERVAVFTAVAAGVTSFRAVVVTHDAKGTYVYPCGACRQVLSEFGDMDVYCVSPDGKVARSRLSQLLPQAFSKAELDKVALERSATP